MSTYAISDIHNDNNRLVKMLKKTKFNDRDHLYVLGDIFDRSGNDADPVGVYFTLLELGDRCTLIKGNHDVWLAKYIKEYYQRAPKERDRLGKYYYNSFELMNSRLTQVDMLEIADTILSRTLQISAVIEGHNYLFAHAMTSSEDVREDDDYYLMGTQLSYKYLRNGINGFISVCGHNPTPTIRSEYIGEDEMPKNLKYGIMIKKVYI